MTKPPPRATGTETTFLLLGLVLAVQGFGSAVTFALWDTEFGVAAVLRELGSPLWIDYLLGAAGLILLGRGLLLRTTRRRARA